MRNSTPSVGLVLSAAANRCFADIIGAIEQECSEAGVSVLFSDARDDPDNG